MLESHDYARFSVDAGQVSYRRGVMQKFDDCKGDNEGSCVLLKLSERS